MDLAEIAIVGAGGFGLEVAMLIEQINEVRPQWKIVGFFDNGKPKGSLINRWRVLGGLEELNQWSSELAVAFAIGLPQTKKAMLERLTNGNLLFPMLKHPSVITGDTDYVEIGEGSILCAGTIITTNLSLGRFVLLNLACTVGHESRIGDFSSFMPTCNISGEVTIGKASFWGTGAKVINRKSVGDYTVIGSGAVVTTNIPDYATAVGVPAKVIKQGA